MCYRIAGIDVHKKMLAVVVADKSSRSAHGVQPGILRFASPAGGRGAAPAAWNPF